MTAYRFCRTDDIPLLVEALRLCWTPHDLPEAPADAVAFKREIRDLQVWCSSCMVAFEGDAPIGVLIGAKRPTATLVRRLAIAPGHERRGHGRHLVESLLAKLAILGPPDQLAEAPAGLPAVGALLEACSFVERARLTDFVRGGAADVPAPPGASADLYPIPVSVEDLDANGLLAGGPWTCWERDPLTLRARAAELRGLGVAGDSGIEAFALWRVDTAGAAEIAALRAVGGGDPAPRLDALLGHLARAHPGPLSLPRVQPLELPASWLAGRGFAARGEWIAYARSPLDAPDRAV